ncbi:MAG: hypothetical protein COA62_12965 [Rhodobiaceae bacterium]|nr:MAG: hypothetical protein COA62_12965 [Rhodobiaceae bacterium]
MNMPLDPSTMPQTSITESDAFRTCVLDRQALLNLGPEWEELSDNALEANAYYNRQYVEALLTHLERRPVKALAVYRGPQLAALLFFVTDRQHWLGLAKVNKTWTTLYTTLTIPLVDKRHADETIEALVIAMGDGTAGSKIWLCPDITLEGDVTTRLSAALRARNLPTQKFDVFERATMTRRGSFEEHRQSQFSRKRRKELERIRRRLSEKGTVTDATYTSGPELDQAVEEFLRIEASGWKGDRGTALGCSEASRAFARQAFGNHKGKSITRADLLFLDGKPIAGELTIMMGRTGFTIKCAFDETYRSEGVGLLLFENCIRHFLDNDWADHLDSAAAGGHMIGRLWNSSIKMGDILFAAGPSLLPFSAYVTLETCRRWARAKAKSIVASLRH